MTVFRTLPGEEESNPPVMTYLLAVLIPQAELYYNIIMIKLVMLRLYLVLYSRVKLVEEDEPLELTNSVERGEEPPPISKLGPPSPSTSQHR